MTDHEVCAVFSENLNRIMAEKSIKQTDIANRLHVSKGSVSAWCKGKNIPRTDALSGLIQMLDVDLSDLLLQKEPVPPSAEALDETTKQIIDIIRQMSPAERCLYLENLKTLRLLQEQGHRKDTPD